MSTESIDIVRKSLSLKALRELSKELKDAGSDEEAKVASTIKFTEIVVNASADDNNRSAPSNLNHQD